jgi:exodeoxyribonuclease-3
VTHADYRLKLDWLGHLAAWIELREDREAPFVVCGDFNVCPTDLDSYGGVHFRGKIHHTDPERALVGRLHAAGLVDAFRARHPDDPGYSWWDYRAGHFHKNLGMRIDLILATRAIADRVTDVFVDREYRKKGKASGAIASDHAPVVAVLS